MLYIVATTFAGIMGVFLVFKFFRKRHAESVVSNLSDFQVLEVRMPKHESELTTKDVSMSSLAAESMFSSLHGLLRADTVMQEHLSFEMTSGSDGVRFFITVPQDVAKFVESQVYAHYPNSQVNVVTDYAGLLPKSQLAYDSAYLGLAKATFYPIKTFRDFELDPLSAITSAMSQIRPEDKIWFQVLVKPIADGWQAEGRSYVETVRTGVPANATSFGSSFTGALTTLGKEMVGIAAGILVAFFRSPVPSTQYGKDLKTAPQPRLSPTQDLELKAVENKLARMGFEVQVRLISFADNQPNAQNHIRSVIASLKQYSSSVLNEFASFPVGNSSEMLENYIKRVYEDGRSFVFNSEELATIYHYPSTYIETPNISWVYSKKSEPPANLPTEKCVYIGETIYRSNKVRFGIKNGDDRLRHMYLIGKSGTGKSTLLETMISQDIANGCGVGVLDPHGETIEHVLERIPDNRVNDVIVFDPSDVEKPVGLNLLEMRDMSQKNLMASALVSAIRHHFDFSWGPRLEYLLNYCILTLLEVPGTTMLGITRLLEDDNYRRYILHSVKDPLVNKFWEKEFKEMKGNQKLVTEAIAPIQNKVNRFLASTTIRNILGQRKSTIDIWDIMNSGKILLMNLSKGKIGEDNANLLGALLVSRIQFMSLQRASLTREQRRPFYLYVDEFQNFATGSFESILSESRKYGLGLYLTHQYTAQLPEELLKAVLGNIGTIATFSLGAQDAKSLAYEFAPYFDENDLIALERFHIYMKLMIDGMTSLPFSAKILVPWIPETEIVPKSPNKQKVLELSRERHGSDRSYVEEKINKWVEAPFDKGMAIAQEIKTKREQEGGVTDVSPGGPIQGGGGASDFGQRPASAGGVSQYPTGDSLN